VVLVAGCRALEFLLQMLPLSSRIAWASFLTQWLRNCPLLRFVILTALLLPHSVPLGQPRLQGEGKDATLLMGEQHVQIGMGRTTGDHLCKQSVISPTTGNHCNIKEIKRKD